MFGGGSSAIKAESAIDDSGSDITPAPSGNGSSASPSSPDGKTGSATKPIPTGAKTSTSPDRRTGSSPPTSGSGNGDKKRRSSGVGSRASSLLASAKNSLSFSPSRASGGESGSSPSNQTPLQKLGRNDPALAVPQGQHNNSAGESHPGPKSTFRVGVWEDRNEKCRRTMEDTHAFLYNFLQTPAPGATGAALPSADKAAKSSSADASSVVATDSSSTSSSGSVSLETDNGYFAVFDGHAGTFAADWCGKKLHLILEDIIRKNPNNPIPELLDQSFTSADAQLEKLPLKNSGCTAAVAVLRWEDRVPSALSATGSQAIATAVASKVGEEAAAAAAAASATKADDTSMTDTVASATTASSDVEMAHAKLKPSALRQRVLYTANVGDARIILCRAGKALRLSYDHKGSDENEGRRVTNAGGLILHNRVNGVLAVTRALGDTYIKSLVTGHPYTTETVIQPDSDEFFIIACDGLWDVCSDQDAVNLVRDVQDPAIAAKMLVDHALAHFSTDNLSCMVVRLDRDALLVSQKDNASGSSAGNLGVEGDEVGSELKVSEADKIVSDTKQSIADGNTPAVGVSASNSGRGHDAAPPAASNSSPPTTGDESFKRTTLDGSVEEEPATAAGESTAAATDAANVTIDPSTGFIEEAMADPNEAKPAAAASPAPVLPAKKE